MTREDVPQSRRLREKWNALGTRARERVILGALFGLAVAARDLVLLSSAAGLFALLELSDVAGAGPANPQPA